MRKKTAFLHIRLSASERMAIARAAEKDGKTMSEWIRCQLLKHANTASRQSITAHRTPMQ